MLDYKTEFNIGDKVRIINMGCVQTRFKGNDLTYLFAKKGKSEYVEYYVHDIEVTYSVKEGFKNCRFLLSKDAEKQSLYGSGWVDGEDIVKIEDDANSYFEL